MTARPINAVTATASGIFNATNAENITFQFNCANHTSGNGVLTLLASNDGVNFTAISFVDPTPANTNAQTLIRLLSKTLSANGAAIGVIENRFKFLYLKFTVTVTTDGTYDVFVNYDLKQTH